MISLSVFCLIPIWLLFSASLTDDSEIIRNGYSFLPKDISISAYSYLFDGSLGIMNAYGITILVTIIGTVTGLALTAMLAYPLSRFEMPFKNTLAFFIFFTMLFNGGLVPTYLIYTNIFEIKNSLWALIVPSLLMNGYFIILMRTFFATSIPRPLIESAQIDGAKEWKIFYSMIIPLSTPVFGTIGLFYTLLYWNDWNNGLIYITDSHYYSLQNLLNRILQDIQFLQSSTQMGNKGDELVANLPLGSMRMAIACIGIVPLLIAFPFFQRFFVKGLTIGSVKG
ncbi:carbohydrate ABC transporter permease [Paenibacillus luteus]|uniref:carbohydrate ABC transporter permease n=1 Tax=Paenibacillus luteus TaxID=2545753 RepID=UPI0011436473|nr:carbohydrate ABC transporter permease [Paenibacillus luteus]